MAEKMITVNASCLCGGYKRSHLLPESVFPLKGCLCSCVSCRHVSGQLYTTFAMIPEEERPSGPTVTSYAISEQLTCTFCNICGTSIANMTPAGWGYATGILSMSHPGTTGDERREGKGKGTEGIVDRQCLFVSDTKDGGAVIWLPPNNSVGRYMKRHVGHVTGPEEDMEAMQRVFAERDRPTADASDRLNANCHCAGVKFFVTRPQSDNPPGGDPQVDSKKWWLAEPGNADCKKYSARLDACDSCRLASGFEINAWLPVPDVNVFTETGGSEPRPFDLGDAAHNLAHYSSSPGTGRSFCKTCGAIAVYWNQARKVPVKGYGVGLFNDRGARCEDWVVWKEGVQNLEDAMDRSFVQEIASRVGKVAT